MKKKPVVILLIVALLILSLSIVYLTQRHAPALRQCPNEWIKDLMPGPEKDDSKRQYFIFNGERKEIKNYDLDWIRSNCSVQVHYVT